MQPTKRCPHCGATKEIEEGFGWRMEKGRRYARSYCKSCLSQRKRANGTWIRMTEPIPPAPKGMARCGHCKQTKPQCEFTKDVRRPSGRSNTCRQCQAEYVRDRFKGMTPEQLAEYKARRAESADRRLPHARMSARMRRFNLTLGQYEDMRRQQGGVCAICGKPETTMRAELTIELGVDHDHDCCPDKGASCGRCVRGLLCGRCNNGIGCFLDNIQHLTSAIAYLERWNEVKDQLKDGDVA